jgi:hypothetical protein
LYGQLHVRLLPLDPVTGKDLHILERDPRPRDELHRRVELR